MTTIQKRRGTAAAWTAANPILAAGETGWETDTHQSKTGDGATHWVSLPYDFSATYLAVAVFNPTDNTTDQKTALNALLTAAAASTGPKRVQIAYSGTGVCIVSAGVVIPSGITLELAPMVTLRRKSGSVGTLILNNAISVGSGRDSDIGIIGGPGSVIDGGNIGAASNEQNLHVRLAHADRVTVRDVRITTTTGGKYALRLADVTDFEVSHVGFSSFSDGCHITGPAVRGKITDIYGTTGDDLVSLCASEGSYNYAEPTGTAHGDITDIEIRSLFSNACPRLINMFGCNGQGIIRNITVDGVHGTTTGAVFSILGDTTLGALDVSGVKYRNLDAKVTAANPGSPFGYIGAASATVTAGNIYVEAVDYSCTYSPSGAVTVAAGSTVERLSLVRWANKDALSNLNTALVANSGTITTLVLDNIKHVMGVTAAQLVNNPGTISRVYYSKVEAEQTTTLYTNLGSSQATAVEIHMSDVHAHSTNIGRLIDSRIAAGIDLYLSNVVADLDFALVYCNGGPVNIRGAAGVRDIQGGGLNRAGSEVVHCYTPGFPCDVNGLAKTTGDQAYNTNGARACGVGPVGYNGSAWVNYITEATF